jgi:hypothetical protein
VVKDEVNQQEIMKAFCIKTPGRFPLSLAEESLENHEGKTDLCCQARNHRYIGGQRIQAAIIGITLETGNELQFWSINIPEYIGLDYHIIIDSPVRTASTFF